MIAPEIIADWQRQCAEAPTGELPLDNIDAAELLRVYAAWQDGCDRKWNPNVRKRMVNLLAHMRTRNGSIQPSDLMVRDLEEALALIAELEKLVAST